MLDKKHCAQGVECSLEMHGDGGVLLTGDSVIWSERLADINCFCCDVVVTSGKKTMHFGCC